MQHTIDSSNFRNFPSSFWYLATRDLLLISIIGEPSKDLKTIVYEWESNCIKHFYTNGNLKWLTLQR